MSEPTLAPAPAAAPPAPAAPPAQPTPAAPSATDPAAELARLQAENVRLAAENEQWKGHSRTWEQRAKAKADQEANLAKVAQALGLEGATPDPAALAQQVAAEKARATALARENAVLHAAQSVGADAAALLDSRTFVAQLENVDPANPEAVKAAVQAAIAANPRYAAQAAAPQQPAAPAQPAPRQASAAGQFGQPAGNPQWTADDVKRASPEALSKAMAEGRLEAYLKS